VYKGPKVKYWDRQFLDTSPPKRVLFMGSPS